jgi:hypothetical protein
MTTIKIDNFVGLSKMHGKARFEKWSQMSTEVVQKGGEWHSVYRYNGKKGLFRLFVTGAYAYNARSVPTQARVYQKLLADEAKREASRDSKAFTPSAVFMNAGLKLQSKQ